LNTALAGVNHDVKGEVMRIRVDRGTCTGHGRCFSLAPEVFDSDDEGFSVVRLEAIPPELEAAARRGAGGCPEAAIIIDDGAAIS
jgi:ferredoxin